MLGCLQKMKPRPQGVPAAFAGLTFYEVQLLLPVRFATQLHSSASPTYGRAQQAFAQSTKKPRPPGGPAGPCLRPPGAAAGSAERTPAMAEVPVPSELAQAPPRVLEVSGAVLQGLAGGRAQWLPPTPPSKAPRWA